MTTSKTTISLTDNEKKTVAVEKAFNKLKGNSIEHMTAVGNIIIKLKGDNKKLPKNALESVGLGDMPRQRVSDCLKLASCSDQDRKELIDSGKTGQTAVKELAKKNKKPVAEKAAKKKVDEKRQPENVVELAAVVLRELERLNIPRAELIKHLGLSQQEILKSQLVK